MTEHSRRLLVTHHAPDLDAVGAVWLFKRFDAQHFADAKVAFVDPGATISLEEAEEFGCQLHEVTHVDTGLGEFDHHQADRGQQRLSAALLVYQHLCKLHPDLADDVPLQQLVEFVTESDHFGEVHWPDAAHPRYMFMITHLIRGLESLELHNDESQLYFGMTCLDSALVELRLHHQAEQTIATEGREFTAGGHRCIAIESSNDSVIKLAQLKGYELVIRKDPEEGNIRIKVRPDATFDLRAIADKILAMDHQGSWYYHPSGKMFINGSSKKRSQTPSPLTLSQVQQVIEETLL